MLTTIQRGAGMSQSRILHITHGDSANERLTDAGIEGERVGWDDPLHHGPIPAGLNLDELTDVRAKFIAARGWGEYSTVRFEFQRRNELLAHHAREDEVVIWSSFELFDQLQLIQLLAWFDNHHLVVNPPSIVWLSGYFSDQPRQELIRWFEAREPVADEVITEGSVVWQEIRSPEPDGLRRFTDRSVSSHLPFLQPALRRFLQEYPGIDDGLSRTQRQVLSILDESPQGPVTLFQLNQERESPAFMGDWSFWWELESLCNCPVPPIRVSGGPFVAPPAVAPM
ncbi:MAG: hypothetical protein R3200_17140, partial [Xanthomonadales bacterium]|nr:hypothetical protein [Xanthomonadales bacterium]